MENTNPRISVNQIASFINATPKGKVNILKLRKFPRDSKFMSNLYNVPKGAIVSFIRDEDHNSTIFSNKYSELSKKDVNSDWQKTDKKNSLLALKQLEKDGLKTLKKFFQFEAKRCLLKEVKYIVIRNVRIDLNPDILLFDKDDKTLIGGIKVYFSKSKRLTLMDGQTIAGLIKQHMQKALKTQLNNEKTFVLDVFGSKIITAPKNFSYHKLRLNSACDEIIKI